MTKERLGELEVLISANTDKYTQGLEKVLGQLNSLTVQSGQSALAGQSLFGSFVGGNLVANMLSQGISKLTGGFVNLAKSIIENGSNFSRMSIATQTISSNLGIATSQMESWRNELAEANTYGTVADEVLRSMLLSDLYKLAGGLRAVDARTGQTKTGLSALVLTFKDLAASAGIDSSEGISRLTKFIRTGTASYVDGIIEVGNLNNTYREYATGLGKSVQNLTETERAQARMNVVLEQGQRAWGTYANTMETSGKAFASIRDVSRNIQEIIGAGMESILRVTSNAVLQFLNGIRGGLNESESSITAWANRVAGVIVGFVRILGNLLSWVPVLGKGFARLKDFSVKPIQAQGKLEDQLDATSGAMDGVTSSTEDLKKSLRGLASFDELNVLSQQSAGVGAAGGISTGGADLAGIDTEAVKTGMEDINRIATNIESTFNRWTEPVRKFVEKLKEIQIFGTPLTTIIGEVTKYMLIFAGVGLVVAGVLAAVAAMGTIAISPFILIGAAVGAVIAIFVLLYQKSEFVQRMVNGYVENMKQGFIMWGQIISGVWNGIIKPSLQALGTFFSNVWNNFLKPIFTALGNYITGFIIPVWKNFFAIVSWVWNGVLDVVQRVWDGIKRAAQPVVNWFRDNVAPVIQNVADKFKGAFEGVSGIVSKLFEGIKDVFKGAINWVIDRLNDLIWRVNDMIGKVNEAGRNVPGWSDISFRVGYIPKLADGGSTKGSTLANIGEAGQEVVLPLERDTKWADIIAEKVNTLGGGQPAQITIKLGEETIFSKFVDWHNDRALLSNGLVLNM